MQPRSVQALGVLLLALLIPAAGSSSSAGACTMEEPPGDEGLPVLAVVVGLEGTGHHVFHGDPDQGIVGIFGALAQSAPREVLHLTPKQPLAALFINTVLRTEDVAGDGSLLLKADHVRSMREAMKQLLAARPSVETFLLESCSFPCFATRLPYFNPDLEVLEEAARGLMAVRMLVLDRDIHDIMTSTVKNRGFAGIKLQANTLRMSLMELSHFVGRLPKSSLAFSSYEQLVDTDMCWERLAAFWRLEPRTLRMVASTVVHKKGSSKGRAAWHREEAAYISDMLESEHSASLWPAYKDGIQQLQLCI